jgi:hypothetical protein
VPTTPADQNGCTDRLPSPFRAAFPESQTGRHPHCNFRGLLRLYTLRPASLLNRPSAAFVTGLQPARLPAQTACQLLDQTGYYRGGILLHWQHAPAGRTGFASPFCEAAPRPLHRKGPWLRFAELAPRRPAASRPMTLQPSTRSIGLLYDYSCVLSIADVLFADVLLGRTGSAQFCRAEATASEIPARGARR